MSREEFFSSKKSVFLCKKFSTKKTYTTKRHNQMIANLHSNNNPEFSTNFSDHDFDISKFIRFLKQIRLKKQLSKIDDQRQQSKITYAGHSLLLWALYVFFFRQGSKNGFNSTLRALRKGQKASLLNYLEIEGQCLPHQNAIDDYLASIDPDQINACLMDLFKSCIKNKIFYNHAEKILPGNSFHLGVDGFWVHHYRKPHATNPEGDNNCPYCLARVHKICSVCHGISWRIDFANLSLSSKIGASQYFS